ncbi:hypothetical protein FKZ61_023285 [Litorilinea aerophila]|uniref:Uncharacterized protein n=2 Tax=Litorilinea aerophila TaxID=1204385 RepID=A0A540V8F4_9CHLR|nr:hypothetical protein [Litorilinea aerophila]OUC06840.1 hypothetical protein RY27_18560 [Litorilinea aerophila]
MERIVYQHTGGPPFTQEEEAQIVQTVSTTEPVEHNLPGYEWKTAKIIEYVERITGCRSILMKRLFIATWIGVTLGPPKGQPVYRQSEYPPRSDRINWYAIYNFTEGLCLIWNEGNCNTEHTIAFLERVADWLGDTERLVVII